MAKMPGVKWLGWITLVGMLLSLPGCAPRGVPDTGPRVMTVFAAASLTESFNELGRQFEAQHPGVKVVVNYGGSQQLVQQLSQGAQADVFASASPRYMEAAVQAGRVAAGSAQVLARNRLVVIFPKGNPGKINTLADLARPGRKLDLADKTVPVGQYALDFLNKAGQDPAFDPQYPARVLRNVVSYESSVKAVVTKVQLGEVDAGIVYVTDLTPEAAKSLGQVTIPDALNTIATYQIAPVTGSGQAELARAFVDLALSPPGQQVLGKYGFLVGEK